MICDVYDDIFDARYLHEFFDNVIAMAGYNITNIANRKTQPYGIDGTCHVDAEYNDEFTILVMTNPEWKKEWGPASFQLLEKYDNNARVIEEHEYVPGRVLVIPSVHPHRGIAPTQPYIYRSSIVFRVTPNFGRYIP